MADTTAIAIYKMGLDTQDYVRGAAAAKQSTDAVVASAEKLATTEEKVSRATRTSGDELSKLAARYDQRIKLEQRLANEQARMARLEREGIGSPEERARVYSLVETSIRRQIDDLNKQEAAMRKSATATGLARHEMINLSRQIQDVGVSLAGGQSPFRILIEQGSQIADIFASSRAAFGETFRSLISWVGRAAGSITGIITIVTALGAAAGALALNWLEGQRAIEKALTGVGERAGVSVAQVQKMAEAASANTRLSTNAARESAAEFIKTGKIYGENIAIATNLTDKFALAMGVSASEGAKQLAEILSDLNKGATTLDKSFGFLDGKTRERISTLVIQNKQQEALALLMEKAAPAIIKAADAASVYAKAWMSVTKAISDSIEMMGRAIVKGAEFDAVPRPTDRSRQGSPGRVAAQELRGELPVTAEAADRATKSVEAYEKALNDAAATAADSRFREFGLAADDAVKSIFSQIEQLKALQKSLEDLNRAQEDARISGGAGLAEHYQDAIAAVVILKMRQEDNLATIKQQNAAVLNVVETYRLLHGEVDKTTGVQKRLTVETSLQLQALDAQIKVYQARGRAAIQAAVFEQKVNELILQGKSAYEAQLIVKKEGEAVHARNITLLKEELRVAEARTGIAKINAQYENDINARLREGATLTQAIAEATIKRKIAIENANTAIDQQIHSIRQAMELERARQDGTEASVLAAQAYDNAIRSGASSTKAAALAAITLEQAEQKAALAAERVAQAAYEAAIAWGRAALNSNQVAANAVQLSAKLAAIGTGGAGTAGSYGVDPNSPLNMLANQASKMVAPLRDAVLEFVNRIKEAQTPEGLREHHDRQIEATKAAQDAARAQQEAAVAAKEAAEAQIEAAKAAREAYISQLDEAVADIVATKLLAGQSAQAVNMLIETGAIQFGTASTRFQTQLDLYKRAGASNAQTAADIRAGIIGEGARPSELLAALDSLTDAVDANTDAQLGLSPFYTSQGDRQLGYRGYTVQKGLSNIPGTEVGGSTTGIPGTGTGTGTQYPYSPGTGGGIMGGIVNDPGTVSYSGGFGGSGYQSGTYVGNGWAVLPDGNWVYLASGAVVEAGTNKTLGTVDTYKSGLYATWWPGGGTRPTSTTTSALPRSNYTGVWHAAEGGIMSAYGPISLRSYQDGGIANGPTMRQFGQQMAMFGEAGPEAFVPLKGGAIPVRIMREPGAANENRPQNVVNITAPLVYFAAEPTRDEVRESAFQAAQMLRRMAMGG